MDYAKWSRPSNYDFSYRTVQESVEQRVCHLNNQLAHLPPDSRLLLRIAAQLHS